MKDFFKYVLATVVGMLLFSIVMGVFMVMSMVGIVACCVCPKNTGRKVSGEEEGLLKISETAVKTYYQRGTGKNVAAAVESISNEEGGRAKSAAEEIDENTIKNLGE